MYIHHFVRSKSQRKKLPYERGVGQKMTKADEGGRGGHPNADNCWRGGEGGSAKRWPLLTEGGGGVYELLFLADVICEQPLNVDGYYHEYHWRAQFGSKDQTVTWDIIGNWNLHTRGGGHKQGKESLQSARRLWKKTSPCRFSSPPFFLSPPS